MMMTMIFPTRFADQVALQGNCTPRQKDVCKSQADDDDDYGRYVQNRAPLAALAQKRQSIGHRPRHSHVVDGSGTER